MDLDYGKPAIKNKHTKHGCGLMGSPADELVEILGLSIS